MTSSFPKSRARGFSLIEVLIAVVIVSLGLLALASLQSALIRSASDAKAQSLAMAIAKQKIEQLAAYQTLGGFDGGCVSPTDWVAVDPSCYRAITDEAATPVDVDLSTVGIDDMGGVAFTVATSVTRYVYNVATSQYETADNTAQDSALTTSPETLLPGKEFKRIVATVAWTDATGSARSIQVEDALNSIAPRDSIAIVNNRRSMKARNAESIIVNPGSVAGVIPIAVGNGSNTAASNPTPELLGARENTYVSETRFDVYTYIPLNSNTALAQSRVETAVVGCRCDTATASTVEKPLRPTYWDGARYAIPTQAHYVGLTSANPTKNYPLAGPKALASGELAQSDQCRVCCRDHHDPAGNDGNGDAYSAVAKVSPRRTTHDHYLVNASSGSRTPAASGPYSEVCRMIRVDGIFRVAADLNNDYFALLPARNTGESAFVPSTLVSDDYGDMVKRYLKARFSSNADATTFNSASSPNPYSTAYTQWTRLLPDGVTSRNYDLDNPATEYLKLTSDARWLHARGLYVDYLEPAAIAKIVAAQSCGAADSNECVLPYLPFTSINLSELAEWKDVAVAPAPMAVGRVISVLNNGFNTATGDATFTTAANSGASGDTSIGFSVDVNDRVVEGMAVSGTGIAPNARIVSINNQRDQIVVDLPNTGAVSGDVKFQATPVRGIVRPGTNPVSGNASNARATASYNNAAIALKYPMHGDETVLTDINNQLFVISATGTPPDPSAGTFNVSGFTNYGVDGSHPKVAWGIGNSPPSTLNACSMVGTDLPFYCPATAGLGSPGGMSVLIGDYNIGGNTKTHALAWNTCKIKDGNGANAPYIAYTGTKITDVQRPYVINYRVSNAVTSYGVAASSYSIANTPSSTAQNANETTTLYFTNIALPAAGVNDVVTVSLIRETPPNDEISADFQCCLVEVSNQGVATLKSLTWKPSNCPFPN